MSAASGTGSLPLGVSEIYLLGLQTLLSKCVGELNMLSVSHQAALKERALMEDRLLQAEGALDLANQKMVQLEGDVVALRKVVIDQSEQLSAISQKSGVLGTKCDCMDNSASDLSSKQLRANLDLAVVQSRVSLLEKAAVGTVSLRHPSAGLADIDGFGSRCAETCGKITEKARGAEQRPRYSCIC